jgi:hypothetical protein
VLRESSLQVTETTDNDLEEHRIMEYTATDCAGWMESLTLFRPSPMLQTSWMSMEGTLEGIS